MCFSNPLVFNLGVVCDFSKVAKIFILISRFYISYMEPLFVVAKIIGSPGNIFPFKIVLSLIMTITKF